MSDKRLYLVVSMAASADRSYTIIGAPIAIYKDIADAQRTANAEMEMQEIIVDDRPFKQCTAIYELSVPEEWPSIEKIPSTWVVWSNMFMQDGSGRAFNRIDGFYHNEKDADEKLGSIAQGDCEFEGDAAILKSGKRRLTIR